MIISPYYPLLPSYYIPTAGGYDRNSNLLTAVDSVMGQWNYTYDNLNRVVTAAAPTSQPAGVNANFAGVGAGWSYDPFGNRQSESWTGNNDTAVPGSTSATYYGNNQLSWTNVNAAGSNVTYDQAGNMTYDGKNSYLYDAEGRICALGETVNGTTILTGYIYDAGGTRVAKGSLASFSCNFAPSNFTTNTSWVLGPGGEQVTEYAVSGGTSTWQHTNVFAAGKLLATYNGTDTYFNLTDWLGSKRVEIDATGSCAATFASLPFGNTPNSGSSYQPGALPGYSNVCGDATEHHFTGKERDTESGNDYFDARYYSSSMGRFMSPDWSAKEDPVPYAQLDDPQSLNLYSYVRNNPLSRTDPDGHCAGVISCTLEIGVAVALAPEEAAAAGAGIVIGLGLGAAAYDVAHGYSPSATPGGYPTSMPIHLKSDAPAPTPEIVVDGNKHPESAQHVADAQAAGKPSEVTIDRAGAKDNRAEALKGTAAVPGQHRDEYPPATTKEGGSGASVRPISPGDNTGSGASMGNQMRPYPDGTKVKITPINVPKPPGS